MNSRFASVLLVLSGATGLVYEVIWSKALADVLGNSGQAHAIVLATFMGGLALGAFLFGGLADRVAMPLALYGAIEIFIGLYALAFPSLQQALREAFLSVAPGLSESSRLWAKLAFAGASLVLPTIAMGGTMPAMVKHVARSSGLGRALAHLYAVNSLGAAVGAWVAGTVSLPAIGLSATARWAAGLNLALGVVAIAGARAGATTSSQQRPEPAASAPRAIAAIVGLVLSGFTAMVYETGWIRVLTLIVGGSTYAFTWIVCTFIGGLALGSAWVSRRPIGGDELTRFGWLQVGVVLSVALTIPGYLLVPWLFVVVQSVLARADVAFHVWQAVMFGCASLVMLVPTFLMGAAFPVGARVVAAGHAALGRRLGLVWAANTIGTVLGALLAGLWLMPTFGLERLFTVGLVLSGLGAMVALASAPSRKLVALGAVLCAVVGSATVATGWAPLLAQLSPFRLDPATVKLASPAAYLDTFAKTYDTNFVRDDTFATVYVGTARKNDGHRFLLVNGKPDASTGLHDQSTQVMLGQLGLLLAPRDPKQVMVIGAGAAVTVGAALTHPIERLDLVEISSAVLEAARFFDDVNGRALDDPRVHVTIDDARTALALAQTRYDVIVSEPSNPWVAGISSLFTDEFFSIVDARLADDGVLVQWLHTYEMTTELVQLVVRTLTRHFPEVTVWQGGDGDLLLIATRRPQLASFETITRRLERAAVRDDLARVDVRLLEGVLARQLLSARDVRNFAATGPLNTDDHNRLEYQAPRAFWAHASAVIPDARLHENSGLLLAERLAQRPLDAKSADAVFRSVAWSTGERHPARRGAAEAWTRANPSEAAVVALAEVAAAQGDLFSSRLPAPTSLALALATLKRTTHEDRQRQGPWLRPLPFDTTPFQTFEKAHRDVRSLLEQVCQSRLCLESP